MTDLMSKIVSLCKRRGFVFPSSEIYGGIQGFYDYGPLGSELKRNIKELWWQEMVHTQEKIVGIDGAIITRPEVWKASGHLKGFTDPLAECKKCHKRFRADHLVEKLIEDKKTGANPIELKKIQKVLRKEKIKCPVCGGELDSVKLFNLLVKVQIGVIEGEKKEAYLKGEACQTIYLNYDNVLNSTNLKIPFGIAQIGKAFRNEITPGHFLFRQKEFEQWDLEWFVNPKEMNKWYLYWKEKRMKWYKGLVNHKEKVRFRQHTEDELAHYAKLAFDIEYETPFGWKEWEGIHWRGDWDLSRHGKYSKKDFSYLDEQTGEKFIPWIVETSGGVDRTFVFLLIDAYTEEDDRVILKLQPKLAPFKIAVFPLLKNKPRLVKLARRIYRELGKEFVVAWDERSNIGKRYYAQDEIGTPWCVTVDFDSLNNKDVTVRDRDTAGQERVKIGKLKNYFKTKLKNK